MHKTAKLQGTLLSSTSQSSQTFIYTCKYVVKENLQKWHKNSSRSNRWMGETHCKILSKIGTDFLKSQKSKSMLEFQANIY